MVKKFTITFFCSIRASVCVCFCNAAVQKIIEVFSPVNDQFDEFQYNMKVYR